MIPRDYITEWRAIAPWVPDWQVEQDLVISRALVDIFTHPLISKSLAFRGGTALYKMHIKPPARYSEDIDLVQVTAEPIGPVMEALRERLDSWLGKPQWKQNEGRVTLNYRFGSEDVPPLNLRLKVEINSREHFSVFGFTKMPFSVSSRWYSGSAGITTYELNELLGTKLRALYQRRKGRDLFDLAVALENPAVESVAQDSFRRDCRDLSLRIIGLRSDLAIEGDLAYLTIDTASANAPAAIHRKLATSLKFAELNPTWNWESIRDSSLKLAEKLKNPKPYSVSFSIGLSSATVSETRRDDPTAMYLLRWSPQDTQTIEELRVLCEKVATATSPAQLQRNALQSRQKPDGIDGPK
jgi:predicted nucleotidyltransferase component of viral defense system